MSTSTPHRRSTEPFLWLLFTAGGMAAAFVLPVLLLLFGLAFPLGWLDAPDHAHLLAVVRNPLTKLVLFGVWVLALFHWAHRFRFTLEHGLQLGRFDRDRPVLLRHSSIGICSGGLGIAHRVRFVITGPPRAHLSVSSHAANAATVGRQTLRAALPVCGQRVESVRNSARR